MRVFSWVPFLCICASAFDVHAAGKSEPVRFRSEPATPTPTDAVLPPQRFLQQGSDRTPGESADVRVSNVTQQTTGQRDTVDDTGKDRDRDAEAETAAAIIGGIIAGVGLLVAVFWTCWHRGPGANERLEKSHERSNGGSVTVHKINMADLMATHSASVQHLGSPSMRSPGLSVGSMGLGMSGGGSGGFHDCGLDATAKDTDDLPSDATPSERDEHENEINLSRRPSFIVVPDASDAYVGDSLRNSLQTRMSQGSIDTVAALEGRDGAPMYRTETLQTARSSGTTVPSKSRRPSEVSLPHFQLENHMSPVDREAILIAVQSAAAGHPHFQPHDRAAPGSMGSMQTAASAGEAVADIDGISIIERKQSPMGCSMPSIRTPTQEVVTAVPPIGAATAGPEAAAEAGSSGSAAPAANGGNVAKETATDEQQSASDSAEFQDANSRGSSSFGSNDFKLTDPTSWGAGLQSGSFFG